MVGKDCTANGLIARCVLIAGQLSVGSTVAFSLILGPFKLGQSKNKTF